MRTVAEAALRRRADAAAAEAVGEGVLIGRAAAATARQALRLLGRAYGARVVVLAGSGHNGADALRAGARLAQRGARVVAVPSSARGGDSHVRQAWAELLRCGGRQASQAPEGADLVLDGMVGAGVRGGLTGRAAELAGQVSAPGAAPVLAVDLPSGVEVDTGAVPGPAVRAAVTVTFGSLAPAHVLGPAAELAGFVVVEDIGLPPAASPLGVLDADDLADLLADPPCGADKYSRGVVGVRAGSPRYPGAAVLATGGAVRAGAGYVRYDTPGAGPAADAVRAAWPTVVAGPGRVDAWVCGPGLEDPAAVGQVLDADTPAVLDAGALALGAAALRARGRRGVPTVITPHAGEFARLAGVDPAPDPLGCARRLAADLGVHVLLKGHRTVVAAPDGRALVNPTGTSWLSTAGTGDVLAGALGALLAAAARRAAAPGGEALDLLRVAAAAAFLHGLAGRAARPPLHAGDLLDRWPDAVAVVRAGGGRAVPSLG